MLPGAALCAGLWVLFEWLRPGRPWRKYAAPVVVTLGVVIDIAFTYTGGDHRQLWGSSSGFVLVGFAWVYFSRFHARPT
jgi:hypothetical protein